MDITTQMDARDDYPDNWKLIAKQIKSDAGWKCERCGHENDRESGHVLTVHHLVPIKSLCETWNLAALCQRCHLQIQAKVDMFQDYMLPHSEWFIPHLEGFLDWRRSEKQPETKADETTEGKEKRETWEAENWEKIKERCI